MPKPYPVSDELKVIDITNSFLPWRNGEVILLGMVDIEDLFIPVFSNKKELVEFFTNNQIPFDNIKLITDQFDFLDSIPRQLPDGTKIHVIVNPRNENDKIRFTEIIRYDS